ncbi:hypothetical protein JCM10207_002953 [Rhodosporidiobolus poonsookiae]
MSFDPSAVAASESLVFLSFTSTDAFELGVRLRTTLAAHPSKAPCVIEITTAGGQRLFFAASGEGTAFEHGEIVRRKRASVLRWGKSTASLYLQWPEGVPAVFGAKDADYLCHGGGFPVRIKGVEPIVAVIVVSGLAQEEDHQIIADAVEKYIKEQEAAQK